MVSSPATPASAPAWCGDRSAKYQAIKEPPLKDDFDEWRARVICYAFSLPPTAFTKQVNRNTAETAQEAALEEGLAPLMLWVKRLIDGIVQRRMGHPDLEFAWADVRPIDPAEQAEILDKYVRNGTVSINEARNQLGMPAFLTLAVVASPNLSAAPGKLVDQFVGSLGRYLDAKLNEVAVRNIDRLAFTDFSSLFTFLIKLKEIQLARGLRMISLCQNTHP
jgi:hypothetical protein